MHVHAALAGGPGGVKGEQAPPLDPPPPVCGLVPPPKAAGVAEFSPRTCRGENELDFFFCRRQKNWGNRWFPLAPLLRAHGARGRGFRQGFFAPTGRGDEDGAGGRQAFFAPMERGDGAGRGFR